MSRAKTNAAWFRALARDAGESEALAPLLESAYDGDRRGSRAGVHRVGCKWLEGAVCLDAVLRNVVVYCDELIRRNLPVDKSIPTAYPRPCDCCPLACRFAPRFHPVATALASPRREIQSNPLFDFTPSRSWLVLTSALLQLQNCNNTGEHDPVAARTRGCGGKTGSSTSPPAIANTWRCCRVA